MKRVLAAVRCGAPGPTVDDMNPTIPCNNSNDDNNNDNNNDNGNNNNNYYYGNDSKKKKKYTIIPIV